MVKLFLALIALAAITAFNSEDAEARGSCFCSYKYANSGDYSPERRGGEEPLGTRKAGKCLEMCKKITPHPDAVNAALRSMRFNPENCAGDAIATFWVKSRVTGTKQGATSEGKHSYTIAKCKKCPPEYHRNPNTSINASNACRRIEYTSAR